MKIRFIGGPLDGDERHFDPPPTVGSVMEVYGNDTVDLYRVDESGKAWHMPPEGVATP